MSECVGESRRRVANERVVPGKTPGPARTLGSQGSLGGLAPGFEIKIIPACERLDCSRREVRHGPRDAGVGSDSGGP